MLLLLVHCTPNIATIANSFEHITSLNKSPDWIRKTNFCCRSSSRFLEQLGDKSGQRLRSWNSNSSRNNWFPQCRVPITFIEPISSLNNNLFQTKIRVLLNTRNSIHFSKTWFRKTTVIQKQKVRMLWNFYTNCLKLDCPIQKKIS